MAYDIDVPSKWREQVDRLVQISNEHDAADFLTKYNIESDTQRALYSRFMLQVACAFSLLFT